MFSYPSSTRKSSKISSSSIASGEKGVTTKNPLKLLSGMIYDTSSKNEKATTTKLEENDDDDLIETKAAVLHSIEGRREERFNNRSVPGDNYETPIRHNNPALLLKSLSQKGTFTTKTETEININSEKYPLLPRATHDVVAVAVKETGLKRFIASISNMLNPTVIVTTIRYILLNSTIVISVVSFIIAWILFYYCGNPTLVALHIPDVTLSWWLNFLGRQLLVLELSTLCQFIVVDIFVRSTRFGKEIIAPWLRFFLLQAHGRPFILITWGLWDCILMKGSNTFQQNWLHFTDITIYSQANPGNFILDSDLYHNILTCMVVVGFLWMIKRAYVKFLFGRGNVVYYKTELEGLLKQIIAISDVAELAILAEQRTVQQESPDAEESSKHQSRQSKIHKVRWESVRFDIETENDAVSQGDQDDSASFESGDISKNEIIDDKNDDTKQSDAESQRRMKPPKRSASIIKEKLDKWQIPPDKMDEDEGISLDDILKFNRALDYMRMDHPFTENFGKAGNREDCIESAEVTYHRLMKLAPYSDHLPYSVLAQLASDSDGCEDQSRKIELKNLFRPDIWGNLSMMAFIQSCDIVYRKLCYFRAAVGNARVIDKQAENLINITFLLIIFILILLLLNLNPWTLIASTSTILVTASFAVGSSTSKSIEGFLLVCVRRPYDIGDRIVIISNPGDLNDDSIQKSWFVENITLFTTTLRFATSGEICTVANSSLVQARITNLNRTKTSVVVIDLTYHISLHDKDNLQIFREKVDDYIRSKPNIWEGIDFLRCEVIDTNLDMVQYKLAVPCRISWQTASRVYRHRDELWRFCSELGRQMNIEYASPPRQEMMYFGGSVIGGETNNQHGENIKIYGRDLVDPTNLQHVIATSLVKNSAMPVASDILKISRTKT